VVQIVLWYLDSGCSKHMTGDRSQLVNFVQKFLGTVKFGNDHVAKIMGYGDYQIGNVTISRVYYVEGLGYNLFSVGQFCDSDLEVAFRQHTCFIRNLDGVDLLTESGEGADEETKSNGESEDEETTEKEEESFDPIPRTPEESEDDGNDEENQGLRISEEERMPEEEEADELYRDVDINQGWGLQVSQDIEDSHVTRILTHSDGQQESSSTSSFMTNLLNLIIDPGMESIFMNGSSTVTPIPSPQSTMTPSIISTFTTASQLPTPPTPIPSLDL
nr:integrase, catalytic region, zinc finger, CCHC-type, peptidase aspartic, catalytic [Tanacetum cinerariifolium]